MSPDHYHRLHIWWNLPGILLVISFTLASLWMHDLTILLGALILAIGVLHGLTTQVVTSEEELIVSSRFFPLPWRRAVMRWTDISKIQVFQNLAFVEADALIVTGCRRDGKSQHLLIPIAVLAHRKEFLEDFTSHLPPQTQLSSDAIKWAESVGTTPRWQLLIALGILVLLAAVAWWSWH